MTKLTTTAVIPMAGLSSRMGSFKPLMRINGFTLAELCVQSVIDAGVSEISVVLGRNAAEVQAVLQDLPATTEQATQINFVINPDFANSDMFCSVKLGLQALQDSGYATFIIPGDVAGILPKTFGALRDATACSEAVVFVPQHRCRDGENHGGHPLLLKRQGIDTVLAYTGDGGLKQAIAGLPTARIDVDDQGTLMDADTPECFARLTKQVAQTKGVQTAVAEELLAGCHTPQNVQRHCRAVSQLCLRMAGQLNMRGYCLDSQLCASGALLHDICRVEDDHPQKGAALLSSRGYLALANIVARHMSFEYHDPDVLDEALLVCLADKLVQEARLVTPEQRYTPAMQKFPESTTAGQHIRANLAICEQVLRGYQQTTGDILFGKDNQDDRY